ncbi:hypothetical protein VTL71DRAFT_7918 [Oculimacula yallundae]|uniref:Uncharacterized protein n=1 Tax=Oculimacula yallundae TaxID=86028 RepID=A0ABR4CW86_9HELO
MFHHTDLRPEAKDATSASFNIWAYKTLHSIRVHSPVCDIKTPLSLSISLNSTKQYSTGHTSGAKYRARVAFSALFRATNAARPGRLSCPLLRIIPVRNGMISATGSGIFRNLPCFETELQIEARSMGKLGSALILTGDFQRFDICCDTGAHRSRMNEDCLFCLRLVA